jgi:hypothetical protein
MVIGLELIVIVVSLLIGIAIGNYTVRGQLEVTRRELLFRLNDREARIAELEIENARLRAALPEPRREIGPGG